MEEIPENMLIASPTVKIWESSLTLAEKTAAKPTDRDYSLIPANGEDIKKMQEFYFAHAIVGYDVQSVEVVYNPFTEMLFHLHCHKLHKREGNPAFVPKWGEESPTVKIKNWRQRVSDEWIAMASREHTYPNIKLLPFWHGTDPAILGSIFETGYANLATTDSGFFGKGLYFANAAEYAYRCYSRGAGKRVGELGEGGVLLLTWVASFSAYPVIHGDKSKLSGGGNYQNYDAHFIPVMPQSPDNPYEVNYYPCDSIDTLPTYYELVVFESAACLPRYLITLQKQLLKSLHATLNAMDLYRQGLLYRKAQDHAKAFTAFWDAAELGLALGQLETGWCYRKGEGTVKDVVAAFHYFSLAAKSGLGCALHELGWCHKRGEGTTKDTPKAVAYFKEAADKGIVGGFFDLGYCYYTGDGVPKDRQKAAVYFKQAADKGLVKAQVRFASCCEHGDGVVKDLNTAITYYRLAAEQGEGSAKERLGTLSHIQLERLDASYKPLFSPLETRTNQPSKVSSGKPAGQPPPDNENCRLQ